MEPNIDTIHQIHTRLQIYSALNKHQKKKRKREQERQHNKERQTQHKRSKARATLGSSPPVPYNNRVCSSPNILFSRPGAVTISKFYKIHSHLHISSSFTNHFQTTASEGNAESIQSTSTSQEFKIGNRGVLSVGAVSTTGTITCNSK